MKVTVEYLGRKSEAESSEAVDITDAFDLFEEALLACGFEKVRITAAYHFLSERVREKDNSTGDESESRYLF